MSSGLSSTTASKMVERLFANERSGYNTRILFPGFGNGTLIEAVYQYCEDSVIDRPEGVAIETDYGAFTEVRERFRDRYPELEFRHQDFLDAELSLNPVDFVIADPPVDRLNLDGDTTPADIAQRFQTVTEETQLDDLRLYMLFYEQALRFLAEDGRLVFITPTDFIDRPEAAPLNTLLNSYVITEVTDLPMVSSERQDEKMTVIDNESGQPDIPPRYEVQAEESKLLGAHPLHPTDVMTPLEAIDTYPANRDADSAYLGLRNDDYDTTLVVESDGNAETTTDTGHIIGYISRSQLTADSSGVVSDHAQPVPDDRRLATTAPVQDLLDALAANRVVFVDESDSKAIEGMVTRFDLNRRPVYVHLYTILADVELGLRQFIRDHEVDWEQHIQSGDAKSIYRNREGIIQDVLSCAQFSQLITVIEEARLHDELGLLPPQAPDDLPSLDALNDLRRDIAHYHPLIHTMNDTVEADIGEGRRTAAELARIYELIQYCLDQLELY